MRDTAHIMWEQQAAAPDKKDEKNLFCSEIHCEIYAALLHHNLPKMKLKQPKVAKMERATGNNTCHQRCIHPHSVYTERCGSCKMASFSDVKLKVP